MDAQLSVPLYLDSDATHTISSNYQYLVQFATHEVVGQIDVSGITIKYTIQ